MKNLKIITFNIRRDREDDGINNWEFRRKLVAEILKKHNPDIAAFQEVLSHQLKDLQEMLPGFQYYGIGRGDGVEAGEFAPIFYKGLTAERNGTFWMSDTPDSPSRTWPGMTRICSWVEFSEPVPFAFLNTHLEYEFESTQLKSIELIKERISAYPKEFPLILVGDFNFNPDSVPYAHLNRIFQDSFSKDKGGATASNHSWTGSTAIIPGKSDRIDYIWTHGNLNYSNGQIIVDNPASEPGVYPSDHWPVFCRVSFPLQCPEACPL